MCIYKEIKYIEKNIKFINTYKKNNYIYLSFLGFKIKRQKIDMFV